MKYQLNTAYVNQSSDEIWTKIIEMLTKDSTKQISSISGKKVYELVTINERQIGYLGDDRNKQEEENIFKDDLIGLLNVLKSQTYFSTSSIKEFIPRTLYRKRSPSFAILKFLQVII